MSLEQKQNKLADHGINIHQELIDRCCENDRKAQYDIYKLYYKAMYNTALRILNNADDAEDIMQESFLDAFRKIDTYHGGATFGSWMKRIVINKSLDELRKRKDIFSIDKEGTDIIAEEIHEDPVEVLSYKVEKIRIAIADLPEQYRIILSLHLLEGYDHEEIAEILNITYGTSRTRYSRARQKLLAHLKKVYINFNVN
ncbi:MAG: RNA polymerase sigma factor [Bacteroidota bacterium]|nr:RNA polymerase sigma factor [Bacteroidota bacterium]